MALTKAQHDAIMRIYNDRELKAQRELDDRIAEVYSKSPEFEEIDKEIARKSLDYAKTRLFRLKDTLPPLSSTIAALKNKKTSLLVSLGYPKDYLAPHFVCDKCHDTGYIEGEKCSCFKQLSTNLLYSESNLKNLSPNESFSSFNLDLYDNTAVDPMTKETAYSLAKKAFFEAKNFVDSFDKSFNNILLYGTTGVGKTFLANCIAKELLKLNKSTIYYTSMELFDALADSTFNKNSTNQIFDYVFDCDLLIIDDLGTEVVNSFVVSQLFQIINERILRKKSTIISTNLSPIEIMDNYNERIYSRISYSYKPIKLIGDDIRRTNKLTK